MPCTKSPRNGLYLVNAIVTSAGGKINVESEVVKGSTFKIILKDTAARVPR